MHSRLRILQVERRELQAAAAAVQDKLAVVQGRLASALSPFEGPGTAPTAVLPSGAALPRSDVTVLSYNVLLPNSVDGWCEPPSPISIASPSFLPISLSLSLHNLNLSPIFINLPQGSISTTTPLSHPPTRRGRTVSSYSSTRSLATALLPHPTWSACRK